MKNHDPRTRRRAGLGSACAGSALVGLFLMAGGASAGQPGVAATNERATPPAAARPSPDMAATEGIPATRIASAAAARIEIKDYEYLPATLTVPAGTTITWTSHDDEPHTVTSSEKVFTSPGLDADEAFSYTFTTPGTYTYHCTLHPHMTGTIIVK